MFCSQSLVNRRRSLVRLIAGTLLCSGLCSGLTSGVSAQQAILRYETLHHPVRSQHGMVVSQRRLASEVGAAVLNRGGNAVDAAVAVGFALAVTLPRAGNIGGGGFALVHLAAADGPTQAKGAEAKNAPGGTTGLTTSLDFRERAPAAATKDMFLAPDGTVDQQRYRFSHLATGVPGTVAGLHELWSRYGTLPWPELLAPAIKLAAEGQLVSYDFASALASRRERLTRHPYTAELFYKQDGSGFAPGDLFVQTELAQTLNTIALEGPDGFYKGRVAELLVAEMRRGGGLISLADLANYRVTERKPVTGNYQGYNIASMPPPSSGGVHIVQMLNVLEQFPLKDMGFGSAATMHVVAETMKRAYADRSVHMGDPDFTDLPVEWLTSKSYAATLAAQIEPRRVTPATQLKAGIPVATESVDTTHFSVMDHWGNAVALTYTLNFSFGNGVAVPGAGFLLNNEMTDFAAAPGQPDAFGLLTGEANSIAPDKRPLSAMTPTMVFKDGQVALVTGSPGGSRIINAVLQTLLNVLTFGDNVASAAHRPRIHHQWMPDVLSIERGFSPNTLGLLRAWGHPVELVNTMGSVQSIAWDGEVFYGAADPRRPGAAAIPAESSETAETPALATPAQ